jgi:DNA-directed RNA polymerase subunit K/omega
MDNKKNRAANTTITRNTAEFSKGTDNIYETVAILSKRANQIAADQKRELHKKIEEFASSIDTMDEIFENREQIEIVRHYEQMPKPTLEATQEYLDDELYFRNPAKDDQNMQRLEEMENETIAETATDKQ